MLYALHMTFLLGVALLCLGLGYEYWRQRNARIFPKDPSGWQALVVLVSLLLGVLIGGASIIGYLIYSVSLMV